MGTPKPASLPEIAAARRMQQEASLPEIAAARRMQQEASLPMQGPPTELQSLHAKIDKLIARVADGEYAAALTAYATNIGRH